LICDLPITGSLLTMLTMMTETVGQGLCYWSFCPSVPSGCQPSDHTIMPSLWPNSSCL